VIVAVIDYGSGNLRSAAKAFERASREAELDANVAVTSEPAEVARASHIVLPGVGAFADCMRGLAGLPGMVEALERAVLTEGRPFLGICVGMQLLATGGHEHGYAPGLNWIDGQVVPLRPWHRTLKVPHMGWNTVTVRRDSHPLFEEIPRDSHFYFVHSYQFVCSNPDDQVASVDYGSEMTAAVGRYNIVGTQFHPEKSQSAGIRVIQNFLKWKP
jgi:glutamine amidotransferase